MLSIHFLLEQSKANGPGLRAVLWLQGCPFDCPGCFNPGLRPSDGGEQAAVPDLLARISAITGIEGVSISGGEPTEQIPELTKLLSGLRAATDFSILLFSGRTREQITRLPGGNGLLELADVLVDGPYDPAQAAPAGEWPSSSNQRIHFLTPRYGPADFRNLPCQEVIILPGGTVIESGLGDLRVAV